MSTLVHILYLIFLFKDVFSLTYLSKYERFSALDGHKCPINNILFNIKNVVSIVECMSFCSNESTCDAISYAILTKECIGCDGNFNSSNGLDVFENSQYYKRSECPDGSGTIELRDNFRLKFYTDNKTKSTAETVCKEELNGRLVILNEQWKMNTVSTILNTCSGFIGQLFYWVDGGRLEETQSDWKFADGSHVPMVQTTFWQSGQPNTGSARCISLKSPRRSLVFRFNDRSCDKYYPSVCEY